MADRIARIGVALTVAGLVWAGVVYYTHGVNNALLALGIATVGFLLTAAGADEDEVVTVCEACGADPVPPQEGGVYRLCEPCEDELPTDAEGE
jgi:hypothetical protein